MIMTHLREARSTLCVSWLVVIMVSTFYSPNYCALRHEIGIPKEPVILFSHIPLFRPDNAGCGPLREHGTIRRGAGPGYQNIFGKRTSEFLLETIKPSRIFRSVAPQYYAWTSCNSLDFYSGDDRDYCEYTHSRSDGTDGGHVLVREITVKSFSPDKSISNPGFHLLSLVPPDSDFTTPGPGGSLSTFADRPCLLPSQDHTYNSVYLPGVLLTLFAFLIRRIRQHRARPPHMSPLPSHRFENERMLTSAPKLSSRRPHNVGLHTYLYPSMSGVEEEKVHYMQRKGLSVRKGEITSGARSCGILAALRNFLATFARGGREADLHRAGLWWTF